MFSLNKSLAQLKSALVDAKLAKKDVPSNGEESTKADQQQQKVAPKRKRGVQKKNVRIACVCNVFYISNIFCLISRSQVMVTSQKRALL